MRLQTRPLKMVKGGVKIIMNEKDTMKKEKYFLKRK